MINSFNVCRLDKIITPETSFLYCLPMIGAGTPYIESLTGYTKRLAHEHSLTVHALVSRVILPMMERHRLTSSAALSSFWTKETPALNGTRGWANSWVDILQQLTGRDNLTPTTMLTWAEVLHPRSLIRRSSAWCPACYEAWRNSNQIIYEPLLWALQVVTVCPIHRQLLRVRCSACSQEQPHLSPQSRPGYCCACSIWLGTPLDENQLSDDDCRRQVWVAEAAGTLLAAGAQISQVPRQDFFAIAVAKAISSRTNGRLLSVERQTGIARATLRGWQQGEVMPQLDSLLEFCRCLVIQPLSMLTSEEFGIMITSQTTSELIDEPKRTYRPVDTDRLQIGLRAIILADETPISMREASRRLGCNQASLQQWFPDECRAISARFLAYQTEQAERRLAQICNEVREVAAAIHQRGEYPSKEKVMALLSKPGFLWEPRAKATWRAVLRELGYEEL